MITIISHWPSEKGMSEEVHIDVKLSKTNRTACFDSLSNMCRELDDKTGTVQLAIPVEVVDNLAKVSRLFPGTVLLVVSPCNRSKKFERPFCVGKLLVATPAESCRVLRAFLLKEIRERKRCRRAAIASRGHYGSYMGPKDDADLKAKIRAIMSPTYFSSSQRLADLCSANPFGKPYGR